nr:helix-turn-helix domain-containing protein [Bacillus sp. REN3]
MKDKTEQIINAAVKVFIKKGLQATTQEIAREADVAEVTLFRKFATKQNLFVTVIKNALEKQFDSHLFKLAEEKDTEEFLVKIIENRLEILSKNSALIKMLVSESLMGNLPDEVNLPNMIFSSIEKGLSRHFQATGKTADTELLARQLSGIFLSQVVFPAEQPYHQLEEKVKHQQARQYARAVLSLM